MLEKRGTYGIIVAAMFILPYCGNGKPGLDGAGTTLTPTSAPTPSSTEAPDDPDSDTTTTSDAPDDSVTTTETTSTQPTTTDTTTAETTTTTGPSTTASTSTTTETTTVEDQLFPGGVVAVALEESVPLECCEAVRFVSVIEDSRCPTGADCIQAGTLIIEVEVTGDDAGTAAVEIAEPPVRIGRFQVELVSAPERTLEFRWAPNDPSQAVGLSLVPVVG